MLSKILINLREAYIHTFKKKILLIEKDKKIVSHKLVIYPLNVFYYFLLNDLLKNNNINIIYELDDLIFYDNNKVHGITINKIMIEFNIIDPQNKNYRKNIISEINKYSKSIPFYIIIFLENINPMFNIEIKFMGKQESTNY